VDDVIVNTRELLTAHRAAARDDHLSVHFVKVYWNQQVMFRLFLQFSQQRFRKAPASLTLADLDAPQILAFLDTLETQRHNSVRSRNLRLAALRSFLRYAALQDPTTAASISRALAIPVKRFDRGVVSYLSREEMTALLNAPNPSTWSGHRDGVMLATMYNTGARVSEITKLNVEDLQFSPTTTLRMREKGRKERVIPLWKSTRRQLRDWTGQIRTTPGHHYSRVVAGSA
jgi:site-specific recombinase XerD